MYCKGLLEGEYVLFTVRVMSVNTALMPIISVLSSEDLWISIAAMVFLTKVRVPPFVVFSLSARKGS